MSTFMIATEINTRIAEKLTKYKIYQNIAYYDVTSALFFHFNLASTT